MTYHNVHPIMPTKLCGITGVITFILVAAPANYFDVITILLQSSKFQTLAYTSDGDHLLAGGNSKFVCLFSVPNTCLLKRFEITCNLSLEGVQEMHDRRQFLSVFASRMAAEESGHIMKLPGVKAGEDRSRRWWRPEVKVSCLAYSPTGQ
ncbi:unnamed protein product [Protopolystoma xenopodis]|uniref:Uncharacterized protein n=1 Tax=Protopolystoma xenopodis TaxID=117903 RepID=A0A448X0E7_9PLAT|nr:unnamed protein product [Protopolystoma xenopodis]